jgi:hypothetical protein
MDNKIRIEIVELNILAAITNAYTFGQRPNLQAAEQIISIEAYDVTQITLSPLNRNVISNAVLKKSFLQLVSSDGGDQTIATLPLYDISKQTASSVIEQQNFPGIDWEKSQIKVADTAGLNVNDSFLFKVKYIKGKRK